MSGVESNKKAVHRGSPSDDVCRHEEDFWSSIGECKTDLATLGEPMLNLMEMGGFS